MTTMLNVNNYEITDGYVGSFWKTWEPATNETFAVAITDAVAHNEKSEDVILDAIARGQQVKTKPSPNHYYDHSYGMIRLIDWQAASGSATPQVRMVRCSCGHSVPSHLVMNASLGTACQNCYDRLSN